MKVFIAPAKGPAQRITLQMQASVRKRRRKYRIPIKIDPDTGRYSTTLPKKKG